MHQYACRLRHYRLVYEDMVRLFTPNSPLRTFGVALAITIIIFGGILFGMGTSAFLTVAALMIIELTFSFDNAIINARVLGTMSLFWQKIFMSVGIIIAVFGMRVIFPIVVVMLSAHLSWNRVIDLAFHHQSEYAQILTHAHPAIASFGGMFLLMLALDFFFEKRATLWMKSVEKRLQSIGTWWLATVVSAVALVVFSLLPANQHPKQTLLAGVTGIGVYLVVHGLTILIEHRQPQKHHFLLVKTGAAGFAAFVYLEVLDASFSFDGVIGAFAITQNVILIAAGLGIGALWVRSMTLFMVRRGTLQAYRYLEHGAHYTILMLSLVLLVSLLYDIPSIVPGLAGVAIIGVAAFSSKKVRKRHR